MPTNFNNLFTSLGLTESETKIYLASLRLGPTSVQSIAKAAKLSRTAAYDTISALQSRGLMSSFERNKKRFVSAEDPDRVISYFKSRIEDMNAKFSTLSSNLSELKMKSGGDRPIVRFYEGDDAVYALFHDFASVHPLSVCELANLDMVYSTIDPKVLQESRKVVDPTSTYIRLLHIGETRNPREGMNYRQLDKSVFGEFFGDIWIYADRVAFVSFMGKVVTIIIEHAVFADTVLFLFDVAWEGSAPKTKK